MLNSKQISVIGGKGDQEGLVIIIAENMEISLTPHVARKLAIKLMKQYIKEKIGIAW